MRESDLPSPDIGGKGHHLRRIAAMAINQITVNASAYGGRHPAATTLSAFFAACKTASDLMLPVAPTMTFTPTAKTYSIAAGAAQVGPVLNTGGSGGTVSYASSDPTKGTVNATTGAFTPLVAGTTTITATITANGGYLGTTKTYVATVTA